MSPTKNLYVRDDDAATWEQAEALAKASRVSVSQIVSAALREFLARDAFDSPQARLRSRAEEADAQARPVGDIIVEVGDPWQMVGFRGRWLVPPDIQHTRSVEDRSDRDGYWGVALTARGRVAVYSAHAEHRWPARLDDYDSLNAAGVNLPSDIRALAVRALGEEQIVWRDI
jgi:hypothetical protein